jgi:hypothetical protein
MRVLISTVHMYVIRYISYLLWKRCGSQITMDEVDNLDKIDIHWQHILIKLCFGRE